MPGRLRTRIGEAWGLVAHSLSGRLLLLTLLFVMITEVVIFFPSIGQLLSLAAGSPYRIRGDRDPALHRGGRRAIVRALSAASLLARAGASAVMLKRPEQRELFLVTEMPPKINVTIDLRNRNFFADIYAGGRLPHERRQPRAACDRADAHQGRRDHRSDRRRARRSALRSSPMPSVSCCWRCCCPR